jgi:hypothetical protein
MRKRLVVKAFIFSIFIAAGAAAQSTQFNFQGSLNNTGTPANGSYDFEFVLYDSLNGGNQIGPLQTRNGVSVTNGVFAVQLDFGASFPGAARFLEIRVRPAGQPGITILTPRQTIDSSPYAIKSLNSDTATNAAQLGGVAANQFVVTSDPRMTDARTPTAGSASYIQNSASQQASSDFNISGTGSANILNAATQYNIGGNRVLRASSTGLFVGTNTGTNNSGGSNSFVGQSAGANNLTGFGNSFLGYQAGEENTTGFANTFVGGSAGRGSTGSNNSFVGHNSGTANTASANSFFGARSGFANTSGNNNAFFGFAAGEANITSFNNSYFGSEAGRLSTGSGNAFFGATSGDGNTSGNFNSFFGNGSGGNNLTGDFNTFVGNAAGSGNTSGTNNTVIGAQANVGSNSLFYATAIGAGAVVHTNETVVLGRTEDIVRIPGFLRVVQLGSPGSTSLCQNVNDTISTCSSSRRYKTNIYPFRSGLSLIDRLRPVSFNWKDGGMPDLGLVAEEVAEVEPLLTTTNAKGEIEGVKYDRIGVVLINALKEQQTEIETLRRQVEELKALICLQNPSANVCGQLMLPRELGQRRN